MLEVMVAAVVVVAGNRAAVMDMRRTHLNHVIVTDSARLTLACIGTLVRGLVRGFVCSVAALKALLLRLGCSVGTSLCLR